jgi:hypothetical protein
MPQARDLAVLIVQAIESNGEIERVERNIWRLARR